MKTFLFVHSHTQGVALGDQREAVGWFGEHIALTARSTGGRTEFPLGSAGNEGDVPSPVASQKRALKLQQQKQKEALQTAQQRERELEREKQLLAKVALRSPQS